MGGHREQFEQFPGFDGDPSTEPNKLRDVNWDIPERAWVVWGGEVVLDGQTVNPDLSFQEVARIECPSPRAITGTLSIIGSPIGGQTLDVQIFQGVGKVDLRREFLTFLPATFDFLIPARILRLLVRVNFQSPPGPDVTVQAAFAPVYPWLDERLAADRRHPE